MLAKKSLLRSSCQWQQCLFYVFCIFILSNSNYEGLKAQTTNQKPDFTAQLLNLEVATGSTFNYYASLHNSKTLAKNFQLSAKVPEGWQVSFKVNSSQVSSVNVEANQTQNISIDITPSLNAKPKKNPVQVYAIAGNDTSKLELEAVVKGSYGIQLTTPTGKLSEDVTEGSSKTIALQVKNTGTIPLDGIDLRSQTPPNWQVTFDSSKILHLEPNETKQVIATVAIPDKTLSGDYQATLSAKTLNTSSDAVFRLTVKASLLTGWLGFIIIIAAVALVYYLIRKYGRR